MLSQSTFPQGEDGLDDFLFTEKNSLASYGYNIQNSQNMDKQKIHYCFTLSDAQMEYLRCKKYKIDRMECFMSLASLAERETTLVSISKTQQVEMMRLSPNFYKLWRLWAFPLHKRLETTASLPCIHSLVGMWTEDLSRTAFH